MAKFKKGQSGNPNGKPKGAISKDKAKFLNALEQLFDKYSGDMIAWLEEVKDVEKRFEILYKYAEFLYPKRQRTDVQQLDENGKPATNISKIIIEHVESKHG
jgi:hypothetical protein